MIKRIKRLIIRFRIGVLHATYHRNMRSMEIARYEQDIVSFKRYAYQAEDAWRKLVILTEKLKQNG